MSTPQNRFAEAVRQRRLAALGPDDATQEVAEGVVPEVAPLSTNRFVVAVRERGASLSPVGGFTRRETDIGVAQALGAGIKQGLLDPLTIFGLDVHVPDLDTKTEKVANVLGSFIGLGIGFIPFAFGSGAVLKGIGLTKRIPKLITSVEGVVTRNPLHGFVQNTLAGTVQIAGTSEEAGDLPVNIAIGATFGAAVEGLFLARAMRGRRGASSTASDVADGSPHGDTPIDLDVAAKELAIAPTNESHGANRLRTEIRSLFEEERSYDEALTLLARTDAETVRIPGVIETESITAFARGLYPDAQILTRNTQGREVFEVLVHNPANPADKLTKGQIKEWGDTGFATGQEVLYGSPAKSYRVVSTTTAEGRIQLQDPIVPRVVFAPRKEEITRPLVARFFSEAGEKRATLQRAILANESEIGVTIPSAARGPDAAMTAKRGLVDITEYEEVSSLRAWLESNRAALADIDAPNLDEAQIILARTLGIKGLVIKESGITASVRVFDQSSVRFIEQPPRLAATGLISVTPSQVVGEVSEEILGDIPNVGLALDTSVTSLGPNGETLLHSFAPSWRSSMSSALRREGVPERELAAHLDLFAAQMQKRLDGLLDSEFLAMKNASEIKFGECV